MVSTDIVERDRSKSLKAEEGEYLCVGRPHQSDLRFS